MEENLHEIDILIEEYPYYALLYFKRTKLLSENKNETYKNALKLASIYAPNRRKLQEFIENPTDYRKQIVVHPEWLVENTQNDVENYNLNLNDEELLKEVLTLEEPTKYTPIPETPIVKEVSEIEEILSHFAENEQNTTHNNTIQEIEQLKQTIQQNQEKARLALFQNNLKKEPILNTADVTTPLSQQTDLEKQANNTIQDDVTEETPIISENIDKLTDEHIEVEVNSEIQIPDTEEQISTGMLNTETEQKPVSLNVPKIKEWFEQELKAVRSEKEEKENQTTIQTEQNTIKEEQENIITEISENEVEAVSPERYMSWLDELLGIEQQNKKTTETQKTIIDKKAIQDSIIDKFLQNQPKISKPNLTEEVIIEDKTETQSVEYEDIASETLAKIFVMQKQYDRAIRIYNILISKNPSQKEQYQDIIKDIQNKMNG